MSDPVFTEDDVLKCDFCKNPMIPNVSTDEDGTGYLWSCTTPDCPDFTGGEIELEDLIACGCPPWIADRMEDLANAVLDLQDDGSTNKKRLARIAELEATIEDLKKTVRWEQNERLREWAELAIANRRIAALELIATQRKVRIKALRKGMT